MKMDLGTVRFGFDYGSIDRTWLNKEWLCEAFVNITWLGMEYHG